jgi:uncharacterized protein
MSSDNSIEFATLAVELSPLPIKANWVLEGAPVARFKVLSRSSDGTARTVVWDCTAGRFNWFYDIDETVYILEGSVCIKDASGVSREVSAGETILFRAGSHAEWTVETYVRKIAFFRNPVPKFALLQIGLFRAVRRWTGLGSKRDGAASMSSA